MLTFSFSCCLSNFRGDYPVKDWNSEFWKLNEKIVGVKAPVQRTQQDLDPPTLFHVSQDIDMIRFFQLIHFFAISFIIKTQDGSTNPGGFACLLSKQ